MIRAIETAYDGRLFRSRAEARWAAFFKALGLVYEYEPEGMRLPDGRGYLVDFRITLTSLYGPAPVFFEVKGDLAQDDGKLAAMFDALPADTKSRAAVLPAIETYRASICRPFESPAVLRWRSFDHGNGVATWRGAFTVCEGCGEVGFEPDGRTAHMACCWNPADPDAECNGLWRDMNYGASPIISAIERALSERFGT